MNVLPQSKQSQVTFSIPDPAPISHTYIDI